MPLSPVQVVQVLEALPVFQQMFGLPESDVELRSRIGALLTIMDGVQMPSTEVEAVIDQILLVTQNRAVNETGRWVKAARQWLHQQGNELEQLVSAYVQSFAREIDRHELVQVASTAVAVLNDGKLSPSEGRQLASQLVKTFDLDTALARVVPSNLIALAQRVAQYRSKAALETDIFAIAQAYLQQFGGLITPALMKQVIQKGTLNLSPEELLSGNWDDLGGIDSVARTFVFKLQLLEADPPITKTAQQIAQQVHDTVTKFNRSHSAIDLTQPVRDDDDLSLSSPLQPED